MHLNINSHKKKGFTLVELLVSITIMMIFTSVMVSFFNSSNIMYNNSERKYDVQSNARYVMQLLSNELKNCRSMKDTDELASFDKSNIKNSAGNDFFSNPSSVTLSAYIEGNDYSRRMYVIQRNNGTGYHELHELNFSDLGVINYTVVQSQGIAISAADQAYYNSTEYSKNCVDCATYTGIISNIPSGYIAKKIIFNPYGNDCFLWATGPADLSGNTNYRLELSEDEDTHYTVLSDKKVADFIDPTCTDAVKVIKSKVKSDDGIRCDLQVKTMRKDSYDKQFTASLNTSVYMVYAKELFD